MAQNDEFIIAYKKTPHNDEIVVAYKFVFELLIFDNLLGFIYK